MAAHSIAAAPAHFVHWPRGGGALPPERSREREQPKFEAIAEEHGFRTAKAEITHETEFRPLAARRSSSPAACWRRLVAALHQVAQREVPLTLAGAGPPQLPALTGAAKSLSSACPLLVGGL